MAPGHNTRSRTREPSTPPISIDPPFAEVTPPAPSKPLAQRPKRSVTKTKAAKTPTSSPRRSARIALLSNPPPIADTTNNTTAPVKTEEVPQTPNSAKSPTPAANPDILESIEEDDAAEASETESELSELSDGLFEREISARVTEAEKPLKAKLAEVTAERYEVRELLEARGRRVRRLCA
ncbi:hypothetical protein F5144DRAFT_643641 [Chaetomium tenue]|uniref:Uncharacterized protein n=1 Tax=Chaetomium tenue TaxID=1854479 RepID=A0ACB7PIV5_9PEZI|nr:hypothetical protein F5144DRAFT_643641 [Chaetomium globosum]